MSDQTQPNTDRLLTQTQVLDRIPVTRGTLYHWRKAGTFPLPIRIGNRTMWRESAITEWIAAREAESQRVSA